MIKVNKLASLLMVTVLILSNMAFAEFENFDSDSEQNMMERFNRGDLSEGNMREMTKAKLGDNFDEMEFQKGMMEFKDRMERKEAFSYEHKGFEYMYYAQPSYEGYSKEHMLSGMIFKLIGDDIDPREIKQYCNEPEKIADIVIEKLKDKVGDLQNICNKAEEHEANCEELSKKGCSQVGTAIVREDATESEKLQAVAYSCPVNKDAIIDACKRRSKSHLEQQMRYSTGLCEKRFEVEGERLLKECENFKQNMVCDKEKYIEQCMDNFGVEEEDFETEKEQVCPAYTVPSCDEGSTLKEEVDANGCVYYYCTSSTTTSCPQPTCEGAYDYGKRDANGCVIYACPTTTACPEVSTPTCEAGTTVEKSIDTNGCTSYYCKLIECKEVSKPTCNADETLEIYYDNAGCVSSYQCVRHETSCSEVSKPECAEGQSLTTKYDERGCVVGYECVSITPTSNVIKITGNVVLSTYDDYLNHCEDSWQQQQNTCLKISSSCDKATFIDKCKEHERKNYENFELNIRRHCEAEIRAAEHRCSRIEEDRGRCFEYGTKRCEQMKGVAGKCKETLTEENLRNFIIEEANKRCKFTDIIENENDIKKAEKVEIILAILNTATENDIEKLELFVEELNEELKLQDTTVYKGIISPNRFGDVKSLPFVVNAKISTFTSSERAEEVKTRIVARHKVEEAASRLVSLRDSDVPTEYLYIIEGEASDILNVSDSLEDIEEKEEQKGLGYKIRLFLGLAKRAEQEEINQLEESNSKLSNSIEILTKLIDEVPSDVAKAILQEQVENLKQQQEDIKVLIETKGDKAKGLFGIFG